MEEQLTVAFDIFHSEYCTVKCTLGTVKIHKGNSFKTDSGNPNAWALMEVPLLASYISSREKEDDYFLKGEQLSQRNLSREFKERREDASLPQ